MNTRDLFWRSARLPLFGMAVVAALFALWHALDLPAPESLLPLLTTYLERYGLITVLIASLLESLLVLGWYFPGGVVIFLAVAASPTPEHAIFTVLAVIAGFYIGYTLNFFLGKYGWYRLLLRFGIRKQLEDAEHKLERFGVRAIFSSYWMPGLGGLIATAAGTLQYQTPRFLFWSLIATTLWCAFWGAVVYALGQHAMELVLNPVIIIGFIMIWGLLEFWASYRRRLG